MKKEKIELILRSMRSLSEFKHIEILNDVDQNLWILTDPSMLEIVLRNLIYNSIKHTPAQSRVLIVNEGQSIKIQNPGNLFNSDLINDYFNSDDIEHSRLGTQGLGYLLCKDFSKHIELKIQLSNISGLVVTEIHLPS